MKYNKEIYKKMKYKMMEGNELNLALSIAAAIILSIAIIAASWLMQQCIDYASGYSHMSFKYLLFSALLIALIELSAGICVYFFRTAFVSKALFQYRHYAMTCIFNKNISSMRLHNTSEYLSALTNDVNTIKVDLLDQIPIIAQVIICAAGSVVLMLYYSPFLTAIALLISLIPALSSMKSGSKLVEAETLISDNNSKYVLVLKDILNGFNVIKSCLAENGLTTRYLKINKSLSDKILNREKKLEKINYTAALSGYITQFAVLLICVYFSKKQNLISAGTVVVFTRLMTYIIDPLTNLPEMLSDAKASLGLMKKFSTLLQSDKKDTNSYIQVKSFNDEIRLRNVNFSYVESQPIIKDWNISLQKGKKYALVGTSGSGKSTLFNLLIKTLTAESGELCFDRININKIDNGSLFKLISIVYQNNFIFDDSIINNITMYKKISEDEIQNIIDKFCLNELIYEKGCDFQCGEEGKNLSGGERQRVALARAYLQNTPILLMDESTSALDKESTCRILDALLMDDDKMIVFITHSYDMNVLSRFDEILAISNGKIVEKGHFNKLYEQKGYVYSLINTAKGA